MIRKPVCLMLKQYLEKQMLSENKKHLVYTLNKHESRNLK